MRASLALLRKDRLWLGIFLAAGVVLGCVVLFDSDFLRLFVLPPSNTLADLYLFLCFPVLALALFFVLRDEVLRTREYLEHRPLGVTRRFWTRALSHASVVLAWPLLSALLLVFHEVAFRVGLDCADPRSEAILGMVALELASFFALALFVLSLPLRWPGRLVLGVMLWFGQWIFCSMVDGILSPWIRVFLMVAAYLGSAERRCVRDPDLPVERGSLIPAGAVTLVGAFLFALFAIGMLQHDALQALWHGRPSIVRVGPTELALVRETADWRIEVLDADEEPTGRLLEETGQEREKYSPPTRPGIGWDLAGLSEWTERESQLLSTDAFRHLEFRWRKGSVRIVDSRPTARHEWTLLRPDGSRLSEEAFFVRETAGARSTWIEGHRVFGDEIFLVDPHVSGVWRIEKSAPPMLVASPLPNDDRPVSGTGHKILGEKGAWEWKEGGWRSVEHQARVFELEPIMLDPDALRPEVEVRSSDGLKLRHRYEVRTMHEKILAGIASLLAVLRPAPSAILGATKDYESALAAIGENRAWILDPLLGGGYAWLLWPNLAVSALLTWRIWSVCRRRNASLRRSACWALAIVLTGLAGCLVFLAIETRRAWRRPARGERPEMVIRAAG